MGGRITLSARLGAAIALLLLAGSAAAQDLSRADPGLRYLLTRRPEPVRAQPRLAPDRPAPTPGLAGTALERDAGQLWVRTLVRVGAGGEAALRRAGAEIRTRAGDIVTARVPMDAVPGLLSADGIVAMEAASALVPLGVPSSAGSAGRHRTQPPGAAAALNDSANANAGLDELRRRVGSSWEGLAGQGVIVGVYDSGLDLDHEDFLDADGNTRVLFAWDQTAVGGPAPGAVGTSVYSYGTECTAATIDAGECPMVDRIGHGTHVTGTAVADGSATGKDQPAWRFPGGAPAADLIVVKGGDLEFSADRLVDGVAYIFARAEALGRPAVVNLSLSSRDGPHDGTTLPEQALDALVGPGRIIVAGAGNAGDHRNTFPVIPNGPNHAQGIRSGSHGVRIPAFTPGPSTDGVLMELWYDGRDSLTITVTSPGGATITATTGQSRSLMTSGGEMAIQNAIYGPSPLNGDHSALIGIGETLTGVLPDTGTWSIDVEPFVIRASGAYHLWITRSSLVPEPGAGPPALSGGAVNRYLVGVPASADRVVAVGAHVTKETWETATGQGSFASEGLGRIAFMSSPGPRRDEVQKPDVTAPGKMVMSSRSSDAILWDSFPELVEADSVHAASLGTSMSAPQVAATVALLLQLEPELTPEDVRDALRLSAASDAFVSSPLPHPVWGAGKLDAPAAVQRIRPDGLAGGSEPVTLSANPVRGDALVINYADAPRSVAIYTLIGERVRTFQGPEIGPLSTVWPLDTDEGGAVANGAYVLVVELPDRRVLRKIFVARR